MHTQQKDFEQVLNKIVEDDDFRLEFEENRPKVLKNYKLTRKQRCFLIALNVGVILALVSQASLAANQPI